MDFPYSFIIFLKIKQDDSQNKFRTIVTQKALFLFFILQIILFISKYQQQCQYMMGSNCMPRIKNQQTVRQSLHKKQSQVIASFQLICSKLQSISNNLKSDSQFNTQYTDVRFENIELPIPQLCQDPLKRRNMLEKFIGEVFKKVIERGFGLLKEGELDKKKTKVYCSQKILVLLIKFIRKNKLNSTDVKYIEDCIKYRILPYIASKYPLSDSDGVSSNLSSKIIVRNDSSNQQNDMVRLSRVQFRYKQSRNYNRQIIEFFNFIIEESKTLEQGYKSDMMEIFTKVQSLQNTQKMLQFDPKTLITKQRNKKKLQKSDSIDIDIEYSQNIKGFTQYLTSKKLPNKLSKFSTKQIQQQNLQITNPELMRVATKWCEHLENYFKPGAIIERDKPFRMKSGSLKYLRQRWMAYVLQALLQKSYKKYPEKYLLRIQEHRNENQSCFSHQKVNQDMINLYSEQEAIVGSFACKIFQLNANYLEGYLNSLIHGVLSAVKIFEKIMICHFNRKNIKQQIDSLVKNASQQNLEILIEKVQKQGQITDQYKSIQLYSPQLITFKISDLLRSKCYSKEEQLHALYCQFERISQENPDKFKIVKVKDRLKKNTKDIQIHMLYKNRILVEVQLALKQGQSKFIQSSNIIQHFLYELQRSQFGPINQMGSVWASYDDRAKYYQSQLQKRNYRHQNKRKLQKCSHKNYQSIELPFKCQNCEHYYYQGVKGGNHISCSDCSRNLCFLCLIDKLQMKQKIHKFQVEQIVKRMNETPKIISYETEQSAQKAAQNIPYQGYLVNIKRSIRKPTKYFKYFHRDRIYLLEPIQGQHFRKIAQFINFDKHKSETSQQLINKNQLTLKKFFKQNIILNFASQDLTQAQLHQNNTNIKRHFIVQQYLLNCQSTYKKQIVLIGQNIDSTTFDNWKRTKAKMKVNSLPNIKQIVLSQNNIQDFSALVEQVPEVQTLIMWNNKLKSLPENINQWKKLKIMEFRDNQIQKLPASIVQLQNVKRLSLAGNKLLHFPEEVCSLSSLESLDLKGNKLKKIPSSIGKLKNLKILYLRKNQFTEVPETIGQLQNLYRFALLQNKLNTIPSSIGNLKKLNGIAVNDNQIVSLPSSIADLPELQQLWLQKNRLEELPESFDKLQKLRLLWVSENNLKKLPNNIGNLKKLTNIRCDGNQLENLPQSLKNLTKLQELKADNNCLLYLPKDIGNCISLETISISNNRITQLPDSIFRLYLKQIRVSQELRNSINKKLVNKKLTWKINVDLTKKN